MNSRLVTDTTDFFSIDYGDEILIGNRQYTVKGHEREYSFGVEDVKYWVKKAVDSETGERKIIKLTFFESFETSVGGVKIRCFRNPDKEGEILALMKNHPCFMQGKAYRDAKDNNVRVLDVVPGSSLYSYIRSLRMDYETYFHEVLPGILKKLTQAFEAIRFLHAHGFRHGDIREDHLMVERDTGNYVWIDFDYDYRTTKNPYVLDIIGLGNILLYLVGKGFHDLHRIRNERSIYGNLIERLDPGDFSVLHKWRLSNLRKLFPFIPKMLNDILLHFSEGAYVYYEYVEELIEDFDRCLYLVL
jgi:serine/threonine protein kinase